MNRKMVIRSVLALIVVSASMASAQDQGSSDYPTAPQERAESTGVTDLMWVAGNLSLEDLQTLLERKEDVDPLARDSFGNTAMHWVAFYATEPAVIDELLEIGVQPDVVNDQGFTAFEIMQGNANLRGTEPYLRLLRAKLDQRSSE